VFRLYFGMRSAAAIRSQRRKVGLRKIGCCRALRPRKERCQWYSAAKFRSSSAQCATAESSRRTRRQSQRRDWGFFGRFSGVRNTVAICAAWLISDVRQKGMAHDFNRPFVAVEQMESYRAIQEEIAARYGSVVRAVLISNREYGYRYSKFSFQQKMKPPPGSVMKIFPGYLVVRKLGTPAQYETWIPDNAFQEMYERESPEH
jgi:hypothetical protein